MLLLHKPVEQLLAYLITHLNYIDNLWMFVSDMRDYSD